MLHVGIGIINERNLNLASEAQSARSKASKHFLHRTEQYEQPLQQSIGASRPSRGQTLKSEFCGVDANKSPFDTYNLYDSSQNGIPIDFTACLCADTMRRPPSHQFRQTQHHEPLGPIPRL
jgi:hypothetical protein